MKKGAKQVKKIVPPSPLVGYVLAFMPILQVPLMATVLGMLAQLIGTWGFFVAVWSIMIAQVMPVVGLFRAVGPHEDYKAFDKAKKGPRAFTPMRICLLLVAVGCLVKEIVDFFAKTGLASNMGMEDIAVCPPLLRMRACMCLSHSSLMLFLPFTANVSLKVRS